MSIAVMKVPLFEWDFSLHGKGGNQDEILD